MTQNRYKKLLMSIGLQRNEADFAVRLFIGTHRGDERRHANILMKDAMQTSSRRTMGFGKHFSGL